MRTSIRRRLGLCSLALLVAGSAGAEAPEALAPEAPGAAEAGAAVPEPITPEASAPEATAEMPVPAAMAPAAEAVEPTDAPPAPALGAVGYDAQGRQGRIHVVARGDTLWEISEAYLGTPWAWPPIWKDNEEIANPHRIYPGDRIWITPWEMRRVGADEAAALLAGEPAPPAAPAPPGEPPSPGAVAAEQVFHRESAEESVGLVSEEDLEGAASIVSAVPKRVLLAMDDRVYIGLGREDAKPGDRFTIFRKQEKVFDPDTGRMLGWHVAKLGWLEVVESGDESSLARIRMAASEIEVGDRVMPREEPVLDIPIGPSPAGVEGRISFFPNSRTQMASQDFVYLNRGADDGLAVGSPLEVYREGYRATEVVRAEKVRVPDRVVARLLVLRAQPNSAVAVVRHTEEELALGDRFRGVPAAE